MLFSHSLRPLRQEILQNRFDVVAMSFVTVTCKRPVSCCKGRILNQVRLAGLLHSVPECRSNLYVPTDERICQLECVKPAFVR